MNTPVADRSILRAREAYAKYYSSRQKKALKVISHTDVPTHQQSTSAICKAVNLSGKPCSNRAVCNGLCKRHQISK